MFVILILLILVFIVGEGWGCVLVSDFVFSGNISVDVEYVIVYDIVLSWILDDYFVIVLDNMCCMYEVGI